MVRETPPWPHLSHNENLWDIQDLWWSDDALFEPLWWNSHNKGFDYGCLPLLSLVSGSVGYPIPFASCLASCSIVWSCSSGQPTCPDVSSLKGLCLSEDLGFCSLFYLGHICIALWDSLYELIYSGIACLACDWSLFVRCPSNQSIVRLIMIGCHCNCLDGQLNYGASAHWLIGGTTMYWLCNWWLCHSTLFQQL